VGKNRRDSTLKANVLARIDSKRKKKSRKLNICHRLNLDKWKRSMAWNSFDPPCPLFPFACYLHKRQKSVLDLMTSAFLSHHIMRNSRVIFPPIVTLRHHDSKQEEKVLQQCHTTRGGQTGAWGLRVHQQGDETKVIGYAADPAYLPLSLAALSSGPP
jgi:hypothetical protein